MRKTTEEKTLSRNDGRKWKFLIREYELVNQTRHPQFRLVSACYRCQQPHRQTCLKDDHQCRQSG